MIGLVLIMRMKNRRPLFVATPYEGKIMYYTSIRNCVYDLNLPVCESTVTKSIKRKGYWGNKDWHVEKDSYL